MDVFDTLKSIYKDSQDLVVLLDESFKMIWCSRTNPTIKFNCLRLAGYVPKKAFENAVITQYTMPNGDRKAIKLQPLKEGEKVIGYLGMFFDKVDVQMLSEKCDHRELILNIRNQMVRELALCLGKTQICLSKETVSEADVQELSNFINARIRKSYGVTVNYEEISSYLVGVNRDTIVNISKLLDELCRSLTPILAEKNCRLTFKIEPDIFVVTKRKHFLTAEVNLITNAYLYNDSKIKEISVALSYYNERQPILTVRDNGVGLESDVFNNAVIPFGLHTPEKEHESLGLAVVNMFCKSVGGRMAHRALLNGGTSIKLVMSEARTSDFLLTLPDPKPIMDKNDYTYQLLSQAIEFD